MGCCCCCCCCRSEPVMNPNVPGRDELAMATLRSIGLSESDIKKFYRKFKDVDLDGSGGVRRDEFFAYFSIEDSDMNRRIFQECDVDKSGVLNFCEFTMSLWNLLSMNSETVGTYIFYLFDDDGTGTLNFQEIRQMVETIHHKSYDNNKAVKKTVEQLRKMSKTLTVLQFLDWSRQNPSITAPLISLQYRLRVEIYGEGFWEELQARRWRAGDKLAPDYIAKVNRRYLSSVDAKEKLALMNATEQHGSSDPGSGGGGGTGGVGTEVRKKAFAERKPSSVASVSGIGEVLPDEPEYVPATIERTLTKILDTVDEDEVGGGQDGKVPKKRKKKKKKKKKKAWEPPPKIKFLPPVVKKATSKVLPEMIEYDE